MQQNRTCYLHIGSGKTGTSSLQLALHRSRRDLARHGYLYPDISHNHMFLRACITDDQVRWPAPFKRRRDSEQSAQEFQQRLLTYFHETAGDGDHHTVIFSSEYLIGIDAEQCRALKSLLEPYFSTIRVVCYIRHPLAHTLSASQQAVKGGEASLADIHDQPTFFGPTVLEDTYVATFGLNAIIVREFHRDSLVNGDIIDDFCQAIGMDPAVADSIIRVRDNESLSMEGAMIADAVATDLPMLEDGAWNARRSRLLTQKLTAISGQKFTLPEKVLAALTEKVDRQVDYTKERFGIDLTPPALPEAEAADRFDVPTLRDIGLLINDLCLEIEAHQQDKAILSARLHLARRKPELALSRLESAFRQNAPTPDFYLLTAQSHRMMKQFKKAGKAIEDGAARFPDNERLRKRKAELKNRSKAQRA